MALLREDLGHDITGCATRNEYPVGYPFPLCASERATSLGNKGRQSYRLRLIAFKPDWFLNVRPFERDLVEAKRLLILTIRSNRINRSYRTSESPEGTVACDLHVTAYLKDDILLFHGTPFSVL
jgi:hypothetical protein